MELADNFQFNYQKLLSFLSRPKQVGYIFARADDYRIIPAINKNLSDDLKAKGIEAAILYLDAGSDTPLPTQMENAVADADALIVANLYAILNDKETGFDNLVRINFAREVFWEFNKPILFWADEKSMHSIANHAVDLFSQRRHTTVHFTNVADQAIETKFKEEGLDTYLSSEKFAEIKLDIDILERRLKDAESTGYPAERIAAEITLPLAKKYAELSLVDDAKRILSAHQQDLNREDEYLLAELAEVLYLIHDYEAAINTLEEANRIIEKKFKDYPESWYINLLHMSDWSLEMGQPLRFEQQLEFAGQQINRKVFARMQSLIFDKLGDISLASGNLEKAGQYFEDNLKIAEQLNKANPGSEQLKRDLSIYLDKLGGTLQASGSLEKAAQYFEASLKIIEQLSKANPDSQTLKRDLSISFDKLGDTLQASGNFEKAGQYFEDSLKIAEQLSKANPGSEHLKRDLSLVYNKMGDILTVSGNLESAAQYFESSLKITEQLSKANPHSEHILRDLSLSFGRIGDILKASGNLEKATQYFENSLKIVEQLIKANPRSEHLKRDLSISYEKLGDIFKVSGNPEQATKYFEDSLKIVEQLSKANPRSEQLKRDISISYEKLGDILKVSGNLEKAAQYFENSLKITEQLNKANPRSEQLKWDISVSFDRLGNTMKALGNLEKASHYFEDSLNIRAQLSKANPGSEQLKRGISISYSKLATIAPDFVQEKSYYQKALDIVQKLSITNPLSQQLKDDIAYYEWKLKELKRITLSNHPSAK